MKVSHILNLACLLCGATLPVAVQAQFSCITNADGTTLTITGYTGPGGGLTIPDAINGMTVTAIGPWAFALTGLRSVVVPGSVATIGNGAFAFCALTNVTLSQGITSIGDSVFEWSSGLSSVTFPASVTNIGNAFYGCTSLMAINVDGQNFVYSSQNGVLFNKSGTTLIDYPFGLGGTYAVPDGVTSIGEGAFVACANVSSVTMSDSVASIGASAFSHCTGLSNVAFDNNITNFGSDAFYDCIRLTCITIPNGIASIGDSVFFGCSGLTNVTIPNGVTSIGASAFDGSGLTTVSIPTTVTNIGYQAFGLTHLTNIAIPSGVVTIGATAFAECVNLASITISNGVINIGGSAFFGCTSLSSVTIPSSVTNIGLEAFSACSSLTAITVDPQNLFYSSLNGVLFDKRQTTLIQYPGGVGGNYTIPDSVVSIAAWAFSAAALAGVVIPNNVTNMGMSAFEDCTSLTNAMIGNGVTSISEAGFLGCTNLGGITIPASVTSIGFAAFRLCSALTSVAIPDHVSTILGYAFADCTSMTNAIIGSSVTNIGSLSFAFCNSLRSVDFRGNAPSPEGVGDIFGLEYANSDTNVIVYYLPGTTGWISWGSTFAGFPTELWFLPYPVVLNNGPGFGVQNNEFGFTISWATNTSVVVEACMDPASPAWTPIATNALSGGTSYFSDAQWTNYPARFYRVRSP